MVIYKIVDLFHIHIYISLVSDLPRMRERAGLSCICFHQTIWMTIFLTKANVCWSARFLIAHVTLCRNLKKTQSFSLLYLSLYHLSSNIYLSYLQYLSNKWCLNPGLLLALFFFSSFLYKKLLNNLFMLTHLPIYLVLHIQFSSTKCH